MVRSFTQKEKAKILWDAGCKTPNALMNKENISQRCAERYVSEFRGEKKVREKNILQEESLLKPPQKSEE